MLQLSLHMSKVLETNNLDLQSPDLTESLLMLSEFSVKKKASFTYIWVSQTNLKSNTVRS